MCTYNTIHFKIVTIELWYLHESGLSDNLDQTYAIFILKSWGIDLDLFTYSALSCGASFPFCQTLL